jgi:hypothetical protein
VHRVFLGAVLGGMFALYFIGTLQDGLPTLAKLVSFSVIVGYAAPKLWMTQERLLIKKLQERLKEKTD